MPENIAYLKSFSPQRAERLDIQFCSYLENKMAKGTLLKEIRNVLSDPPADFFSGREIDPDEISVQLVYRYTSIDFRGQVKMISFFN
jgi:hypothetical protein